jgi:hypothetical protein
LSDETGALAGADVQAEISKHPSPIGITEGYVLERDGRSRSYQRSRFRVITQVMRNEKRCERLREARQMLRDVYQCDG